MTEVIRVENLHKRFKLNRKLSVHAVNGINFSINPGETLGLVGESGSGKTTVGRCILRLIEPTEGKIVLFGSDMSTLSDKQFNKIRYKVQIVFQEPYESLNPRKVVSKIVEDPLTMQRMKEERYERHKRVIDALEMVELSEGMLEKYPIQLTQGEQQRVGIARALITNPHLIVLDEPTSLLDIHFRAEIVNLLKKLQKELGIAFLFISHDLVVIAQLSHKIAVMYLGRIVEEGSTEAVFNSPIHPYTKALLNASLFPDPNQIRGGFKLKSEIPSPVNLPDNRCNLAPRCPLSKKHCYESLPKLSEIEPGHYVACFEAYNTH